MASARMMSLPSSLATHTTCALTRLTPVIKAASNSQCDTSPPKAAITADSTARRRTALELGQLGGWCQDALHVGAEIDDHSGSLFDTSDRAETVLVVGDLVVYEEPLRRHRGIGNLERTGCQVAPGPGAVRAHCYQYAPAWAASRQESPGRPGRGRIRTCGGSVGSRIRFAGKSPRQAKHL